MLGASVESVNSALKRGGASLQSRWPAATDLKPSPAPGARSEDAIVAKFISAWEAGRGRTRTCAVTRQERALLPHHRLRRADDERLKHDIA
jgi:hypothetical protein